MAGRIGMSADYYALLGVRPDAGGEVMRAAFRQLAKRLHPDVSRLPSAAERFRRVVAAYETLSDPVRRAAYDAGYRPVTAPGPVGSYGPSGEFLAPEVSQTPPAGSVTRPAKPETARRPAGGGRTSVPAGRRAATPRGPVTPVAPIGAVGSISAGERARRAAEAIRAAPVRTRCVECGALVGGDGDRCVACLRKYGTFQDHLRNAAARSSSRRR